MRFTQAGPACFSLALISVSPAIAQTAYAVPIPTPDSVPAPNWKDLHRASDVRECLDYPLATPLDLVLLLFHDGTDSLTRSRLLALIDGQVVGGNPIGDGGVYYVRLAPPTSCERRQQALIRLGREPAVETASPELLPLGP